MNILRLSLAAAAATGLAVTGISWSQPHDTHCRDWQFPISIADAEAKAAEVFARIDTDDNGEITSAEFAVAEMPKGHRGPRAWHHFRHSDSPQGMHAGKHGHGDDAARAERRDEHQAELFAALDTDGNGQLSAEEFDREHRREIRKSLMKARAFEHLDADANGVLSRSEFPGRLARLKDLDADGNGEVSRDELRDGMRARHNRAG